MALQEFHEFSWTAAYDTRGNLQSVTDNSGVVFSRILDNRNRTTTSTLSGPGMDSMRTDFTYDAVGRRTSETRFSDLAGSQKVGRSQWLYDPQGRLTDLTHFNALDAVLVDFDYQYDAAYQLIRESGTRGTTQYTYDDAGQLIEADRSNQTDETYAYDANGNRQGTNTTTGPNNQLVRDANFAYVYDNEGNLVTKTSLSSGEITQFTYDHRNRLTQIQHRSSSSVLLSQSSYKYDTLNRRIQVDVDGLKTSTAYVGTAPWADFNNAGNILARYVPGESVDEVLARYRPGEGPAWYLEDRLGSIRGLADNSGAIINSIEYDSFGNILAETNPSRGDRFKFTGRDTMRPRDSTIIARGTTILKPVNSLVKIRWSLVAPMQTCSAMRAMIRSIAPIPQALRRLRTLAGYYLSFRCTPTSL